ncbi:hypothetical protein FQZ97_784390 [compost metagenome]
MEARVVQLGGVEAAGQLAGGLHRQLAETVDLDVAAAVQGDAHLVAVQCFDRPAGRQRLGQLLALGDEGQRAACGAGQAEVLLPVRGVDVEVAFLDPSHQGGVENLRGIAAVDLGRAQRFAFAGAELAVDHLDQFHHHRQAGEGLLARLGVQRFEYGAAEAVVKGAPTGGVVATKSNNDRQTRHHKATPLDRPLRMGGRSGAPVAGVDSKASGQCPRAAQWPRLECLW